MLAILLAVLLAAPTAQGVASPTCTPLAQVLKEQSTVGVATTVQGQVAQQLVDVLWGEASKPAPKVDQIIVTALYNGTINIVPVTNSLVCLSALPVSADHLKALLAKLPKG
jgi:hypothetical protein